MDSGMPTVELRMLPLDQLEYSEDDQTRTGGISTEHVEDLIAALQGTDPATWDPLLVTPWGEESPDLYAVLGGAHRLMAAQALGVAELPCRVKRGADWEDGFADNLRHGMKAIRADRKQHALRLRARYPDMAQADIAARCGVSQATVSRFLQEDEGQGEDEGGAAIRVNKRKSGADAIGAHVQQVMKLHQAGAGRGFFGRDTSVRDVRRAIDQYSEDARPEVAAALHAWAVSCATAAKPYLEGDTGS